MLIPVIDLKNLIEDNEIFNSEKTSIDFITGEISEIELAFDSNDAIEEFTITFAVGSYWLSNGAA